MKVDVGGLDRGGWPAPAWGGWDAKDGLGGAHLLFRGEFTYVWQHRRCDHRRRVWALFRKISVDPGEQAICPPGGPACSALVDAIMRRQRRLHYSQTDN